MTTTDPDAYITAAPEQLRLLLSRLRGTSREASESMEAAPKWLLD